jgi:hypothetical protein
MLGLFFVKKHKNKVLYYISSILEHPSKAHTITKQEPVIKPQPTPKYSREIEVDKPKSEGSVTEPRFSIEFGDKGLDEPKFSRDLDLEYLSSSSNTKYSDRAPATDSFDPERVADTMRSHLNESGATPQVFFNTNVSFVNKLEQHIRNKHMDSTDVYKAAHIDRRLFSKIICNRNYLPSKDTVIAFVFALKLNFDEAKDLLERAGYSLSHSIRRDIIIEYFIKERVYNLNNINAFLYNMNEKIIGKG